MWVGIPQAGGTSAGLFACPIVPNGKCNEFDFLKVLQTDPGCFPRNLGMGCGQNFKVASKSAFQTVVVSLVFVLQALYTHE